MKNLDAGYFLIESMIAFLVLNIFLVVLAQTFMYSINQYSYAQDVLQAVHLAANQVESSMMHNRTEQTLPKKFSQKVMQYPIEKGTGLQHYPDCSQKILKVIWQQKKKERSYSLAYVVV